MAFSTLAGLYQFVTLQFGLLVDPATFQCLIDWHTLHILLPMDDVVIIISDTRAKPVKWVAAVLESLRQAGFRGNSKKCAIGQMELQYLGYYLGGRCMHRWRKQ